MIGSKPYGNTVKPKDMTKKQRQRNLTQFFIEEIDYMADSNSLHSSIFEDVMKAWDAVQMPNDESEKIITVELTNIEVSVTAPFYERDRHKEYESARRIKEVLRDCNMWTIEKA